MIAPVPPDPEPIYVGTSVCYAPGYEPPAKVEASPDPFVLVLLFAVVAGTCFAGLANLYSRPSR
jgi:hypothetical protein